MLTRNTRRKIRNGLIGTIGCRLVKLWIRTLRIRLEGFCFDGKVALPPESGIYVLWHQRLFTPAAFFRKSGFRVMVSEHSDGEMIARILQGLGMSPVRGSTARGGVKAVRELLREDVDRSRLFMVIAADGPRGPPRRFQAGAIFLASKTHLRDRDGSLRLLDDSLRRLATDHLDLWQLHDLRSERDLDRIFGKGGAIEAVQEAITARSDVASAILQSLGDGGRDTKIVAYVVAKAGVELDAPTLRRALVVELPTHMVPAGFVFLDARRSTPRERSRARNCRHRAPYAVRPKTPRKQRSAN